MSASENFEKSRATARRVGEAADARLLAPRA